MLSLWIAFAILNNSIVIILLRTKKVVWYLIAFIVPKANFNQVVRSLKTKHRKYFRTVALGMEGFYTGMLLIWSHASRICVFPFL